MGSLCVLRICVKCKRYKSEHGGWYTLCPNVLNRIHEKCKDVREHHTICPECRGKNDTGK